MASSLPARAIGRLRRSWNKALFDKAATEVLGTAPLEVKGHSPIFLSMVCHRDVAPYLVAIKSLYCRVGHGRVTIIDDGSLTEEDLATLHRHIPGLEVIDIGLIETSPCPRGGTWERLVKIIELSRDSYVIQLDADTLVSGPISEVVTCLDQNRSFLLGTDAGQTTQSARQTALMVQGWIKKYGWTRPSVVVESEAILDRLSGAEDRLYVHASSGFAGFSRSAFSLGDLQNFSMEMCELLGEERWKLWGTEQISSNYMLANAPGAAVLPFPRYACFEPHLKSADFAFLHFIGTYRLQQRGVQKPAKELHIRI